MRRLLILLFLLVLPAWAEPLASWNEPVRSHLLDFVQRTVDPSSPDYKEPGDRLAAFDLDGTLWPEKPMQFLRFFTNERIRAELPEHPEWRTEEPFRSALENNIDVIGSLSVDQLDKFLLGPYIGRTPDSQLARAEHWLYSARHPRFQKPFAELIYLPQMELIHYLEENGFQIAIVSASDQEFVRCVAPLCSVQPEHALGSLVKLSFTPEGPVAAAGYLLVLLGPNKPIALQYFLGKQPVLSVGNSNGDIEFLTETARRGGLSLLIHHTDEVREYRYDHKAEKALEAATEQHWIVVGMKKDWKAVFSP